MTNPLQNPPVELISERIDEDAVVRIDPPDTQQAAPASTAASADAGVDTAPGAEEKPLVILLHGLGSHEGDLAGLVPYLPSAFTYASLRGIYRYVQGYAWMGWPMDAAKPETLETSAAAVEAWISAQSVPVVGAIGFSQGGFLALQLLRRDPHALEWIVQLSGAPFPAPMPGDAALAEVSPPALWGHGGLDPHFGPEREPLVREFMRTHTRLEEERRPHLGHAVDEIELRAIARFLQRRAEER